MVGFFIIRGIGGSGGGASSPEEAVERLLESLASEDAVGAAAVIDPDEVHTLGDLLETVQKKAAEAKIDTSPGALSGFDLEIDRIRLRSRELGTDAAEVEIAGASFSWEVEPGNLAERLRDVGVESDSGRFEARDLIVDGYGDHGSYEIDPHLVTIRKRGRWYVSIGHTVGSYLVRANALPAGDYRRELPTDLPTSGTPEDAVVDFFERIGNLEVEDALQTLPLDEWGVLWTYRAAIEEHIDRIQPDEFSIRVDRHETGVSDLGGGRKKVTIERASGQFRSVDSWGDRDEVDWEIDGPCWSSNDEEERCFEDGLVSYWFGTGEYGEFGQRSGSAENIFVVVEPERGGWVVSPNATLIEHLRVVVEGLTPERIYALIEPALIAPAEAKVDLGETVRGTINSGGYLVYEVDLEENVPVVLAMDGPEGSLAMGRMFDPHRAPVFVDGWIQDQAMVVTPERSGVHRVAVHGSEGDEISFLARELPRDTMDGSTASGRLDFESPVIVLQFTVSETGFWFVSGSDDLSLEIEDEDGVRHHCSDYSPCDLRAGITYQLFVSSGWDADGLERDYEVELLQGEPENFGFEEDDWSSGQYFEEDEYFYDDSYYEDDYFYEDDYDDGWYE